MNLQTQRASGFECPSCKGFIPVSMTDLIQGHHISCPLCSLQLSINQQASQCAINALEKVQKAQQRVENASVFSR